MTEVLSSRLAQKARATGREYQILTFIHRNAHRAVRIADLAEEMCLSTSRAAHVVKEIFGVGFRDLLMKERMDRAKALLSSSPHSLPQIAIQCGFNSASHFSRTFRARNGVRPGQYRRSKVNREIRASEA